MNRALSVSQTSDLFQELRSTALRIQEQHAKLERDTAQRRAAMQKESATELQRAAQDLNAKREQLRQEFASRIGALTEAQHRRNERILAADSSSRKQQLQRIEQAEGRRKFAVQKGTLDTDKFRDNRLAELEREFQDFTTQWQEEQRRLISLRAEGRKALRAYWTFPRLLDGAAPDQEGTGAALLDKTIKLRGDAEKNLGRYRARVLPVLFRFLPIWLWLATGVALYFVGPSRLGLSMPQEDFQRFVFLIFGGATALYFIGWPLSLGPAKAFAHALREAEAAHAAAWQAGSASHASETEGAKRDAAERVGAFQEEWEAATRDATGAREHLDENLRERMKRAMERNAALFSTRIAAVEGERQKAAEALERSGAATASQVRSKWEGRIQPLDADFAQQKAALESEWKATLDRIVPLLESARNFASEQFLPWSHAQPYEPADSSLNAVKFGDMRFEVPAPFGKPGETAAFEAPLTLVLPDQTSIYIESDGGREAAIRALNNIVYRILQTVPPGKAAFTFVDPVHLGESFSAIMHLADYEENIVHRRIWTEPGEIEERLLELNAHMEKVIQMYLRNEYQDIVEYNREAGRIAEKYHFLVIADFPANFSDTAMRRLLKIAASGARCGVYMLIHSEKRVPLPPGFDPAELIQSSVHLQSGPRGVVLPSLGRGAAVRLDAPPEPELATRFLQQVGEASRGSNTVQVPFAQIAPKPAERWSLNTTEELRVPIGRAGASKLQYFSLGKGTRQHVLIAGKTGSGKSTLFHVLVTNLALWSSPDQVEFYLVDFKKGVEFKDYGTAKLPHAKVVAIESDREFGLSVLRRVDEELRLRGELFRAAGAQDIAGYKRATDGKRMPRVLLIVDEFQELFTEDDAISQNAALLLDRIVRQGRAFGIHVVLGSQTLGGAYSLARSTLGQMVVRIALQCNEADAYLIMDESNPAPRLLSRPGEGIYNDSGGALEANSPFQVVWLSESERRAALHEVRKLGEERGERNEPIVFEGNSLADLSDNPELAQALVQVVPSGGSLKAWLGLPNEIKGPTRALFDNRSGRNLLIAGQHDDHVRALLASAMISLAAQAGPDDVRFVILENPAHDGRLSLAEVAARLPHPSRLAKPSEIGEVFRELAEEVARRESGATGPRTFVLVHNLSSFKALRPEDEFSISLDDSKPSPAADFQRLYTEGSAHGMHVIAHVDGFNNASRFLGRKGLKEFSSRVLFQMSANDSASFVDDPRAGSLGLNRALLYDEQEGTFETFRPYARPDDDWLRAVETRLKGRARPATSLAAPA